MKTIILFFLIYGNVFQTVVCMFANMTPPTPSSDDPVMGPKKKNATELMAHLLKKIRPFRPLNPTTEPVWEFEDLDYESEEIVGMVTKAEHKDCFGEHVKCILNVPQIRVMCGSSLWRSNQRYYSQCEMDYRNCLARINNGLGVYGSDYRDDYLEVVAEGYVCFSDVDT